MAVNLSPVGGVAAQFFTNTGAVLTGGKLYTYAAGTTTPVAAYTSSVGTTPWSNPIVLDAAGRVSGSGEIWLTDGVIYKFVLKDSNDVLIATYDNITGINSNSVAYTNQQEIVTATAGQTVFNLGISYQPGTNSLSVFVDGVNQYGPGAQYSYVETDSTTVTFNSGLHVGAEVKFTTTQQQGAGAVDASQVTYDPPFTGSVVTNVEAKLAQTVSVKDFGAVGDGVTDDTAAIQAALDYAASSSGGVRLYFPFGTYRVTSTLALTGVEGLTLYGDGGKSSKIFLDSNSGSALYLTAWVNIAIYDMAFEAAGIPNVDPSRTNTALRLNGTGGGSEFLCQNVYFSGFKNAITTLDSTVNDDLAVFRSCYFKYNIYVWNNSNEQAVNWAFEDCQVLYTTGSVFKNPAGQLKVINGSYINQGIFCDIDLPSAPSGILFEGVKFETTQNFDPPGTPVWLAIGESETSAGINCIFRNCSDVGGGAYAGPTWYLRHGFDVTIEQCVFINGTCEMNADSVAENVPSTLTVINSAFPPISETLYSTAGYIPVNKIFSGSYTPNGTNARMLAMNNFSGSALRSYDTLDRTYSVQPGQLKVCSVSTIGTTSPYTKSFALNVPTNAAFVISAVDFYFNGNTPAATITLWKDSSKTTKIYEVVKASPNTVQVEHLNIDQLPNVVTVEDDTGPLYLEVTHASNLGKPTITIILTLLPVF